MKKLKFLLSISFFLLVLPFTSKVEASTPYDNEAFDAEYYLTIYSDLKASYGNNYEAAYNHYIECGIKEGRTGSFLFDVQYYLNNYDDLCRAFGASNYSAAYEHFITCGIKEGRQSSPYFDVKYYINNYADLKKAFNTDYKTAYNHFINCGIREGRRGSSYFDISYYINNYPDLKQAFNTNFKTAFYHYILTGINEGRNPSKDINIKCYLNSYSDLKKAYKDNYKKAAEHYYTFGVKENRFANHQYTEHIQHSSCTEVGKIVYTCKCGDSYEVPIPAKEHTFEDVAQKLPTCLEPGYTAHKKCTVCGYTENKVEIPVASNNHSGDNGVKTPAVHTTDTLSDGYTTYTCTVCKTTKIEQNEKAEHTLQYSTGIVATHERGGYSLFACTYPGCEYTEKRNETPILHESFIQITNTVEPTCTTSGYIQRKCTNCGWVLEKEILNALGHELVDAERQEPTCTENGYESGKKCNRANCSYTQDRILIPKTGHALSEQPIESVASVHSHDEFKLGYKKYKCSNPNCPEPDGIVTVQNNDVKHEYQTIVHPAVHTADKLELAYTASTCKVCGYISRKIPFETADAHQIIEVQSADATCATHGHGTGTRCKSENCSFNEEGGGATAFNTSEPTGQHDFDYRDLTDNEKILNHSNAVQIKACKKCSTPASESPYLTLDKVFEDTDVVVIYGDFCTYNMHIPTGKTLIVYGSVTLYEANNINDGTLFYGKLRKSSTGKISKEGTLISEDNEEYIKQLIKDANSSREFEKPAE